jgi:hypothetical protein
MLQTYRASNNHKLIIIKFNNHFLCPVKLRCATFKHQAYNIKISHHRRICYRWLFNQNFQLQSMVCLLRKSRNLFVNKYVVLSMIYLTTLCSFYLSVAGPYEDNEWKIICKKGTVFNSEVLYKPLHLPGWTEEILEILQNDQYPSRDSYRAHP